MGVAAAAAAWIDDPATRELAKLEAAYILSFARCTQWPAEAFGRSPLVVSSQVLRPARIVGGRRS